MSEKKRESRAENLAAMMKAESVAIVGISGKKHSFGWQIYDNLQVMGYRGKIYGVNPGYETLFGQEIYPSLSNLPEKPDCAILGVSNSRVLAALEEASSLSIPSAVIYASAYGEEDGIPLQDALVHAAEKTGMVICGPNCMGLISLNQKLPMYGYPVIPGTPAGNITYISHSGSVWDAMLQNNRGVHYNYIISAGNEMVTTMADYMLYALSDPTTKIIGLFIETVRDPDNFCQALQLAAHQNIPVVALKVGRSKRGAKLAHAHTGALAGEDATYDALFKYYGVQRVRSLDEMMDTLELFGTGMRPSNSKLAAILDSGGERSLMVDLAEDIGVEFAELEPETIAKLEEILEPGVEAENPLDAYGTGNFFEEVYTGGIKALDADPNTGLTILCVDLYPTIVVPPTYGSITIPIKDEIKKPFVVMPNVSATAADFKTANYREAGIPVLMGTETGLRAVNHVFNYAAFQRERQNNNIESAKPILSNLPSDEIIKGIRKRLELAVSPLDEVESKRILSEYGINVSIEEIASTLDQVLTAAEKIGFPVVLKTAAGATHKTEVNGIHLNLTSPEDLTSAYKDFESRLGAQVVVQEMVTGEVELILGIVIDRQFGSLLMVGIGGILVELMKDSNLIWLPTDSNKIEEALLSLKFADILNGIRGQEKSDLDSIVDTALRLGHFANDCGDLIAELDINPLMARPSSAIVVDALIIPKSSRSKE